MLYIFPLSLPISFAVEYIIESALKKTNTNKCSLSNLRSVNDDGTRYVIRIIETASGQLTISLLLREMAAFSGDSYLYWHSFEQKRYFWPS